METAALEEGEPGADEVRPSDRYSRLRSAALARGIPLPAILTTCGVVVLIYLLGKLAFRMRDVLLMILVAGFIALILNPMVLYVQRRVPRRGVGARDAGDDLRACPPADARGAEDMVWSAELTVTSAGGAVVPGSA
jgi:hypothetical protein